ncbi:hypothetical protein MHPYR_90049 [uncultured Mycobacterium sp.]|uniref:Uncharacterized protein n=1 Tax=uncultured Mycobacterium sp. TaxID=171292 RepID=A0A1Y5PQT4_9MYCO|nr:hypothetical protein MHPYR_90049 [uncultured Mycobacterium sp.]
MVSAHPGDPALVVGALLPIHGQHLGVGQHQKCPVGDRLDHEGGDRIRADHRTGAGDGGAGHPHLRIRRVGHTAQQRGVHAHRTDAANPDSLVAVGDRQPFGEPDGGVFGHAVGRGAELGQQAGGRGDGDEMTAATLNPFRHNGFGCPDVGAQVDVDDPVPRGFVIAQAGFAGDAGIGDVDVDLAELLACGVEQYRDTVRAGCVRSRCDAADQRGGLGGRSLVDVARDHRCASRCQRCCYGPADARACSGDHRHRSVYLHGHMSTASNQRRVRYASGVPDRPTLRRIPGDETSRSFYSGGNATPLGEEACTQTASAVLMTHQAMLVAPFFVGLDFRDDWLTQAALVDGWKARGAAIYIAHCGPMRDAAALLNFVIQAVRRNLDDPESSAVGSRLLLTGWCGSQEIKAQLKRTRSFSCRHCFKSLGWSRASYHSY